MQSSSGSNHSTKYRLRTKQNKTDALYINEFIADIRNHLIVIEERNIAIRCATFQQNVNVQTWKINDQLFNNPQHIPLAYTINKTKMKEFLSYIYMWNGLTKSSKIPETRKKYLSKARNWLNGRRAKKYGNTLFVDMLEKCRQHAQFVSEKYYNDTHTMQQRMYYIVLLSAILAQVLSAEIVVNQSVQKSFLICDHSIVSKTKVRYLLQEFAEQTQLGNNNDNIKELMKGFPCHRQHAVDYFKNQSIKTMKMLLNWNETSVVDMSSLESIELFIRDAMSDINVINGIIYIKLNKFNVLLNIISSIKQTQKQNMETIRNLMERVQTLESKRDWLRQNTDNRFSCGSLVKDSMDCDDDAY